MNRGSSHCHVWSLKVIFNEAKTTPISNPPIPPRSEAQTSLAAAHVHGVLGKIWIISSNGSEALIYPPVNIQRAMEIHGFPWDVSSEWWRWDKTHIKIADAHACSFPKNWIYRIYEFTIFRLIDFDPENHQFSEEIIVFQPPTQVRVSIFAKLVRVNHVNPSGGAKIPIFSAVHVLFWKDTPHYPQNSTKLPIPGFLK